MIANVFELRQQQIKISEGLSTLNRKELLQLVKMYSVKIRWSRFKTTHTLKVFLEAHLEKLNIDWVK